MNERDETTTTRTTTTTTTTNEMDTPVVRDDAATDKMGDTMARGDVKMAGAKTAAGNVAGAAAPAGNVIGMTVNDAGGETIGTVAEYNEQEGYLVLMGGWLFAKNTRVPLDAIGDRGASGLYTTAHKDELLEQYGDEEDRRHAQDVTSMARTAVPDEPMAESGTTPQLSDVNVPDEEDTSARTTPTGLNQ